MSSRNELQDDDQPSQFSSESQSPNTTIRRVGLRTVKRSRTGCLTCRARKVKCDESQPTCHNCRRCVIECRWPVVEDLQARKARRRTKHTDANSTPTSMDGNASGNDEQPKDPSDATSDLDAARGSRITACHGCCATRFPCSRERPVCSRCRRLNLVCKYRPSSPVDDVAQDHASHQDTLPVPDLSRSTRMNRGIDEVPKNLLLKHIQAFFTNIYPCQANGFLHRGTLLQSFHSDRIDRKLLLAICAAASRFVSDPAMASYERAAEEWAKEAKTLLVLEDMTTDTVAAALLLARHEVNSGNYSSAWMLSSMATRAALALGLNKESRIDDANMPFTEQEARRRLFWACYCLDRMMSTGLSDLVILRDEHIRVQLPCEEHQFLFGISSSTPVVNLEIEMPATDKDLPQFQHVGLFGHYVQVMQMRYSILKYVRNHPEKGLPPWDPSSTFAQCDYKMSTWKQSLPPQFQLLPDTIYIRQSQDELSPLLMLHVWYEQCMSDLYRIVMPGFPETLPDSMLSQAPMGWVQQHQSACASHATNISSIFETAAALVDMEKFVFLDTSLPMCVFESMCVRLQWLFMPPSEGLEERVEECRGSFTVLMTYIRTMAKYFRQAKWLLGEMRKTLARHGIHIFDASDTSQHDSSDGEAGSHPWQKRIQRLTNNKSRDSGSDTRDSNHSGVSDLTLDIQQTIIPAEVSQAQQRTNSTLSTGPIHAGPQYQIAEGLNFHQMLYEDGIGMAPTGWGEAEVVPGLANFMGMAGEWVANGMDEEVGLAGFEEPRQ